jgi:hypothetical protein
MLGETVEQLKATTNKDTEVALHVPPGVYFITAHTAAGSCVQRVVF